MRLIAGIALVLLFGACQPDEIGPQSPLAAPQRASAEVLVLNEGNFRWGNASLGLYLPERQSYQQGLYLARNASPLGDVLQDLIPAGDSYYLNLNGSNLIRRVDTGSFALQAEGQGLGAPFYGAFADGALFVSDVFAPTILVLSADELKEIGRIAMPEKIRRLFSWQGVLIAEGEQNLYRVNPRDFSLMDSLRFVLPLRDVRISENRSLLVLSGDETRSILRLFLRWEATLPPARFYPGPLRYAFQNEGRLYAVSARTLVRSGWQQEDWDSLATFQMQSLYGFGYDAERAEIYLADALDYNQNAEVYRFDLAGELLHRFEAGPITNGFYFKP